MISSPLLDLFEKDTGKVE
ncbi:hypothetical protein A2U01_0069509, partial [Trifolium medium]|nr:hypothetical protein [Trifolium medium]